MSAGFDHSKETLRFWRGLIQPLLSRQKTPFTLVSAAPVRQALAELETAFKGLPVRHWLSCKTQPLRPLLRWWRSRGRPIEVVSEFEFLAARAEGFVVERILLNGPAKQHWLPRHAVPRLQVNFDSIDETAVLAPLARQLKWTVGLRVNTRQEFDPEAPEHPTQFGMTKAELAAALALLRRHGVEPQILHFHLRTNVAAPLIYRRALEEAAAICGELRLRPKYVDCGGGFPPPRVLARDLRRLDARFSLKPMKEVYRAALRLFPSAAEIWLENGRWLTARSGALVVKVLDSKERRGMRCLICDGGRTLNALVANWETHELLWIPAGAVRGRRSGSGRAAASTTDGDEVRPGTGDMALTTVTGPTCMAFDQLARCPLPKAVAPGDFLVWLEAGAYHLPWETRFSHGLAAVLWHDGRRVQLVRPPESFAGWWGQWKRPRALRQR